MGLGSTEVAIPVLTTPNIPDKVPITLRFIEVLRLLFLQVFGCFVFYRSHADVDPTQP